MDPTTAVKGTRDFYPEDMAYRRWLYAKIRQVSESFGYQEYEGPYLERLELYAAKSGEELVREQSFVFEDRGGEMIALRPELTPTLARMVAARGKSLMRPLRWWSFGPFWRYERPQKGRAREFFQWNIDLMGEDSPQADAEIAAVGASFFRAVGLAPDVVRILVNDRRLADAQLEGVGILPEQRPQAFRLIDRIDRVRMDDWSEQGQEAGFSNEQLESLVQIARDDQGVESSAELIEFLGSVEALGVRDYFEYDPSVVRGLDYYTGIVFEARDVAGNYRAILGGGRYDDLVAAVGGDPLPATGFAMGDMVLRLTLDEYSEQADFSPSQAQVFVPTFDESTRQASLGLSAELRSAGFSVEWYPSLARLPKQLKYADRLGIPLAAIIGPDELEAQTVALKDLRSGEQETLDRSDLIQRVGELLSAPAA